MPAMPNVPQVLKARVNWQVDGDSLADTIHHFLYSGSAPSASTCATIGSDLVAVFDGVFASLCNTFVGANQCEITDLTSPTSGQGTGGTPWVGSRTGGMLSPGTATLINHAIARRYRGGKPRSYMPFGTSTDIASTGLWSAGFLASVNAAWASFISDFIGLTVSGTTIAAIVNVSYFSGFTVVTSPTTGRSRNVPKLRAVPIVDNFTAHTASRVIASQRRRNRDA